MVVILCYMDRTMENRKQAMNDFNIVVNLDSKYAQVYL